MVTRFQERFPVHLRTIFVQEIERVLGKLRLKQTCQV
jgi:hypothetical protein